MPEPAEALLRRYYDEVWLAGRVDALDDLLAPGYRDHDPPPGYAADRAGARELAAAFVTGLRDPRLTILTLVAAGDVAAAHWRLEWTQHGPLLGDPALAGRRLAMRGADTITVAGGRIAGIHHVERLLPEASPPSGAQRESL